MSNVLMAPRKNKRSEASKAIAQAIIDQYHPACAEDMQDTLRDIFGPMFESMLQGEMNCHLGYDKNDRGCKETADRRNGVRTLHICSLQTATSSMTLQSAHC